MAYFGYAYGCVSIVYLFGCILYGKYGEKWPLKLVMAVGLVLSSVAFFIVGPSDWFLVPDILWLKFVGLAILGVAQVTFFLPIIPEMIETITVELDIQEGDPNKLDIKLNDKVNDIYAIFFSTTMFLAPNIGSFMYARFGGQETFNIMGLLSIFVAVICFFFNCGTNVFQDFKKQHRLLSRLRKQTIISETGSQLSRHSLFSKSQASSRVRFMKSTGIAMSQRSNNSRRSKRSRDSRAAKQQ